MRASIGNKHVNCTCSLLLIYLSYIGYEQINYVFNLYPINLSRRLFARAVCDWCIKCVTSASSALLVHLVPACRARDKDSFRRRHGALQIYVLSRAAIGWCDPSLLRFAPTLKYIRRCDYALRGVEARPYSSPLPPPSNPYTHT